MANIAKLTAGALSTVWGTAAFNAADLNSLANGSAVLASTTAIDNTTNLDDYCDINLNLTIGSSTLAAGAFVALYIAYLNEDASTYGDGAFTAGTQAAHQPGMQPVGLITPTITGSAQTAIRGSVVGVPIARKKFLIMVYNSLGFAFAATAGNIYIDTTNYNLNG